MKVDKSKQVNLKLSVYLPLPDGCNHAQAYMKKLGITYKYAVPQSISDSWWFFDCKNVPDYLPDIFGEIRSKPNELVGYGLSAEMAEDLEREE